MRPVERGRLLAMTGNAGCPEIPGVNTGKVPDKPGINPAQAG